MTPNDLRTLHTLLDQLEDHLIFIHKSWNDGQAEAVREVKEIVEGLNTNL